MRRDGGRLPVSAPARKQHFTQNVLFWRAAPCCFPGPRSRLWRRVVSRLDGAAESVSRSARPKQNLAQNLDHKGGPAGLVFCRFSLTPARPAGLRSPIAHAVATPGKMTCAYGRRFPESPPECATRGCAVRPPSRLLDWVCPTFVVSK